jgi:uncharacterized protein YdhG (YjbR/CyaY superfamily)
MSVIDDYLDAHASASQRPHLEHIREVVKTLVPDVDEVIGYGIPTLKYKGKNLIHFAAFKNHMSIFPTASPVAELKEQLADYTVAKGTIQFTEHKLVPDKLLREIIMLRKYQIDRT